MLPPHTMNELHSYHYIPHHRYQDNAVKKLTTKKMNIVDKVSLKVKASKDGSGEDVYNAFTNVMVDVRLEGAAIGKIRAVLVDRQAIADKRFL